MFQSSATEVIRLLLPSCGTLCCRMSRRRRHWLFSGNSRRPISSIILSSNLMWCPCGEFVISSLVRRFSIVDGLLLSSFCLRDCKIVMLTTYVTNLIPKLVVDATSLMPWFYLSTAWRSSSTRMQRGAWLHATAMTLLRSMNGHQTRQILIWLIIMCGVPRWKPITSWISQAGQVSNQQPRSFKQDWRWSGMTFLRNLWLGLSRTFVSDCKLRVQGWRTLWTFSVTDFMLMCLRTRFPSSFLENFAWYALGWKFLFQNLRL